MATVNDTTYSPFTEYYKDGLTVGCEVRFIEGQWRSVRITDVMRKNEAADVDPIAMAAAVKACELQALVLSEAGLAEECENLEAEYAELEAECEKLRQKVEELQQKKE